jgi:putative transposase
MTEIPTCPDSRGRKLYPATVIDLYSRRLLGAATGLHLDAELACAAIKMAVATRDVVEAVNQLGWHIVESKRVIFHTNRGHLHGEHVHQSGPPTRDPAVDEPGGFVLRQRRRRGFLSSLEWEVLSRHDFENTHLAQAVVLDWCYGFYNHDRRHSSADMMRPINYENTAAPDREAA